MRWFDCKPARNPLDARLKLSLMDAKTQKSEMTQIAIIDAALGLAMASGLDAVTLQAVADKLHLSKSGIFSRVGSKESLQIAVVDEFSKRFLAEVFLPAMQLPKGVQRLDSILAAWLGRVCASRSMGNCLLETAAFSIVVSQDNPLQAYLLKTVAIWRTMLRRTIVQCIDQEQLRADSDPDALLFELSSIVLGVLYDWKFLGEAKSRQRGLAAYQSLIQRHAGVSVAPALD